MSSDLTQTLMLTLEQRPALERSAFLLHAVFGVPAEEVAARLRLEPSVVHELVSQVRRQVREAHSLDRARRTNGSPTTFDKARTLISDGGTSYH